MPGLRGKFALALIVASVLPLAVGVIVLQTAGFRHLLAERGRVHEAEAHSLAASLDLSVAGEAGKLRTWLDARPEAARLAARASEADELAGGAIQRELEATEELWGELGPRDEPLRSLLANPAAASLREFLASNPNVAELILSDRFGRLIAATRKTSDFDQSDEAWWSTGLTLEEGESWIKPFDFDESAGVYAMDVVQAFLDPSGRPTGVVKMVVEVPSLVESLGTSGEAERIEVVLADGSLIARPGMTGDFEALSFGTETLGEMRRKRDGWTILEDASDTKWMAGYSAIESEDKPMSEPMAYVVFASRRSDVVAPVRSQLGWVALAAGAGVLSCMALGYALIRSQLLNPLGNLRMAARSVARSTRLHLDAPHAGNAQPTEARRRAEEDLERIESIRTRDEIEALASDIAVMSSRVLRYQDELESEVEAKTSLIREDLEMAREFQQAMLPSVYPEPPRGSPRRMRLDFAHYYQPASTVGGDFFDLVDCGNGRVGVLIADVMGHGARSALVTAILRALVQNHRDLMQQPDIFLSTLNTHLHELIERSGQMLFVSAFYMLLDPEAGRVRWAVAGHPPPLRARIGSDQAPEPMWKKLRRQPALGLVGKPSYHSHEEPLRAGDVFLLYTDGVIEAEDPEGTIFGSERLLAAFREALDGPLTELPSEIVRRAAEFHQSEGYEDDVCVLAIEACLHQPNAGKGRQSTREPSAIR